MNKTKNWITIFLSLLSVLILLISQNFSDKNNDHSKTIYANTPTYKSDHDDTIIYNPEGLLNYRLVAQHVEYFSEEGVSWFIQPLITTFDINKLPTWMIKSDKAKLTKDCMLYLHGHVEVNALSAGAQLRKITTDNAKINLVTQDVTSQDLVRLYGTKFNSSGMKMRGNLRKKNAELIEKVITSYEIQKQKTKP